MTDMLAPKPRKGVSLFVTMSALLILTALVVQVTAQLATPTYILASARNTATHNKQHRSALQVLAPIIKRSVTQNGTGLADIPVFDGSPYHLDIEGETQIFALQDVNGLLDVNAASSALMGRFLESLGYEGMLELIKSRRAAEPFRDVQEFLRFLNVPPELQSEIAPLLTTNSGRRRINGQTAPMKLLEILSGQRANREQLLNHIGIRLLRTRPITLVRVTELHSTST